MPNPTGQPLVPVNPVRWAERQTWRSAFGGPNAANPTLYRTTVVLRDGSPRRRVVPGSVISWHGLAVPPPQIAVYYRPIIRDAAPRRRTVAGSWLKPLNAGNQPIPPVVSGQLLVPLTPVRLTPRQLWRGAFGGNPPQPPILYRGATIARDPAPRRRVVPGRVLSWRGLAPIPPQILYRGATLARDPSQRRRIVPGRVLSWRGLSIPPPLVAVSYRPIVRDSSPQRRRIAGWNWRPNTQGETPVLWPWRPTVGGQPRRRGALWSPSWLGPAQSPFVVPTKPASDPQPQRRRLPGWAWLERFASPGGAGPPPRPLDLADLDGCYLVAIAAADPGLAEADQDGCYLVPIRTADIGLAEADQDTCYLTA
jgi:hypothetical protein